MSTFPVPSPLQMREDGRLHASLTDLRSMMHDVVARVAVTGDRVYLERHGKVVAVLVHPEDLRILEAIEDARDAQAAADGVRSAKRDGTVPHDEVAAKTKKAAPVAPTPKKRRRA